VFKREIDEDRLLPLALEEEELGVLAADLDHRPRLGMELVDRPHLGDQLVHVDPSEELGEELPARAARPQADDRLRGEPTEEVIEDGDDRGEGSPMGPAVVIPQEPLLPVEQDHLDRH
jgi:hypothetical protein